MKQLFLLLLSVISVATSAAPIWREISIPTRAAAPKNMLVADLYANDSTTPKPVILIQTPYNKLFYRFSLASVLNNSGASVPYDSVHYNYVIVDWRGFYANKAMAITPYDRGLDGYDIVEWIAAQPWSNGKIGTWGGSALGFVQFQTAAQHPPHLVCAAPFIKDFATKYEDYYYGGVFRREHTESLERLGFASIPTVLSHPTLDNTWKLVQSQSDDASKYAVPMFLCSGWFDHFPDDVLRAFADLQRDSDPAVRSKHKLLFGPFEHSQVGQAEQGVLSFPDVEGLPSELGMQFFDHYLRGLSNGWELQPTVRYYQMGENRWKNATTWPLPNARLDTLYIHEAHALSTFPPLDKKLTPPDTLGGDARHPVPTIGGSRFNPADKTILTGPQDIQALLSGPDQWHYQTDVLSSPLSISGESKLDLYLSSSTKDADLSARLCDVYPDGRWIILTQGIQRLRLRNSVSTEELMPLNDDQKVSVHFQNIAQTFLPGHRLGILLSTSNYPMFDLNLNDGGPMYTSGDTTRTRLSIQHDYPRPSAFIFNTAETIDAVENGETVQNSIEIQPNPASQRTTLRLQLKEASAIQIRLTDMLGREVMQSRSEYLWSGIQNLDIALPDMPSQPLLLSVQVADHWEYQTVFLLR